MFEISKWRWMLVVVLGGLATGTCFGQAPGMLPPGPVPVKPSSPPPPTPPPVPPPLPPTGPVPTMPADPVIYQSVGPPTYGDQHLPPPGWFANIDLAVVAPRFKNQLSGMVTFPGGTTDVVEVPGTDLDWTFSPKIEVGYRFPLDLGSVLIGYRSLVSEGKEDAIDSLGDSGFLMSRLNLNQVDLDYRSMEFDIGHQWQLYWRAGVRFASIYYDSQVNLDLAPSVLGGGVYTARVSNNFIGAGPHAMLEMNRCLAPGLDVYGNLEGAVLVGRTGQSFEEIFNLNVMNGPVGAASNQSMTQAVPMLAFQLGLRWTPLGPDHVRLSLGYQYEYWWMLGRMEQSRGDLESQGVFVRGEFRF